MKKRVGILTLPLSNNYGGIIQAVALSQHLDSNGYEVFLLNKRRSINPIERLVLAILENIPFQNIRGIRENARARKLHRIFIDTYIPNISPVLRTEVEMTQRVKDYDLDAVIVGSDQVWRLDYLAKDGYREFFLSFVTDPKVLRISYAASFGVGEWQYPDRTKEITHLLAKFDAISVREESGIELSRKVFGVSNCCHTLDPTLLVDPSFYNKVAAPSSESDSKTLLIYLLDSTDRESLLSVAVKMLGESYKLNKLRLKDSNTVDLPHWLRAFMDADYVITDSFHGTVFSILFRRPFIAIANTKRGSDRFESLLNTLGLRDRLINANQKDRIAEIISIPIQYDQVHGRLDKMREKSNNYLTNALEIDLTKNYE